jgi:predicted ATPase/DNA-binding CsgD family transcriptional regulator
MMSLRQDHPNSSPSWASAHPASLSLYALTPLLGRETALADLHARALDPYTRILTLSGPSGVGKSRLAVALFDLVVEEFTHGGRYVDVAGSTPANLLEEVATAVGAGGDPGRPPLDRLIEHLRGRHFFLLIDSAEHVIDAVALMVVALVAACPRLTTLVASTETLGVYGEQLIRLGPLELPGTSLTDLTTLNSVPSVRLFVHRARAVRSGFRLTPENQRAITALCNRLDGLPLAIELAAARLQLTAPQNLLAKLDGHLDLLRGTRANTLSRHLSLRESFERGWRRLSAEEQDVLLRIAVFAGEFGRAEVSAVADLRPEPAQDLLANLVDKSFLLSTERPDGDVGFRILCTTREYLLDQGGESAPCRDARERHAAYVLSHAKTAARELAGPGQGQWLDWLRQHDRDLSEAADYLVACRDALRAGELAVALRRYWMITGEPREAARRLRQALSLGAQPDALRARNLAVLGEFQTWLGDTQAAREQLSTAAELYRGIGDEASMAGCAHQRAALAYRIEGPDAARRLLKEATLGRQRVGDRAGKAFALADLAGLYRDEQAHDVARATAEDAIARLTELGDARGVAHVRYVLADVVAAQGDLTAAERHCREALVLLHGLGDRPATVTGLITQCALHTARHGRITDSWRRVARVLGAASAISCDIGGVLPRHLEMVRDGLVAEARARLGDDAFYAAWAQGGLLPEPAAVAEAVAPVAAPRSAADPGSGTLLTMREQEVANLVAEGLTNREIARRLGIAEWTVVNHMRKVMRKLRCSSRVQVARWVTQEQEKQGPG